MVSWQCSHNCKVIVARYSTTKLWYTFQAKNTNSFSDCTSKLCNSANFDLTSDKSLDPHLRTFDNDKPSRESDFLWFRVLRAFVNVEIHPWIIFLAPSLWSSTKRSAISACGSQAYYQDSGNHILATLSNLPNHHLVVEKTRSIWALTTRTNSM